MSVEKKKINRISPLPLYHQLKEIILEIIEDQRLMPGDSIPSENELIRRYEISRTTVRQAITELIKENKLETIRGKGTFIAKPEINLKYMHKMDTFDKQILELGLTPKTQVLSLKLQKADAIIAEYLQLKELSEVVYLKRVRYANEEPIVIVNSYHPYPLCKSVLDYDMNVNSLYNILAKDDITKVCRVKRYIQAIGAGEEEIKYLKLKKGMPIQHFLSIGFNKKEIPIEYSISNYRGDKNIFSVEIYSD